MKKLLSAINDAEVQGLITAWDSVCENNVKMEEFFKIFESKFDDLIQFQKTEIIQYILMYIESPYITSSNKKIYQDNAVKFLKDWALKNTDNMFCLDQILKSNNAEQLGAKISIDDLRTHYFDYCTIVMRLANDEMPVVLPNQFYHVNDNLYAQAHLKLTFYLLASRLGQLPEQYKYLVAYRSLNGDVSVVEHFRIFQNILSGKTPQNFTLNAVTDTSVSDFAIVGHVYQGKVSKLKECIQKELLTFSEKAGMQSFYKILTRGNVPEYLNPLIEIFYNNLKYSNLSKSAYESVMFHLMNILCLFVENKTYKEEDVAWAVAYFKIHGLIIEHAFNYYTTDEKAQNKYTTDIAWVRTEHADIIRTTDTNIIRKQAQLVTGVAVESPFNEWRKTMMDFYISLYDGLHNYSEKTKRKTLIDSKFELVRKVLWRFYVSDRTEDEKVKALKAIGELLDKKKIKDLSIDTGLLKTDVTLKHVVLEFQTYLKEYQPGKSVTANYVLDAAMLSAIKTQIERSEPLFNKVLLGYEKYLNEQPAEEFVDSSNNNNANANSNNNSTAYPSFSSSSAPKDREGQIATIRNNVGDEEANYLRVLEASKKDTHYVRPENNYLEVYKRTQEEDEEYLQKALKLSEVEEQQRQLRLRQPVPSNVERNPLEKNTSRSLETVIQPAPTPPEYQESNLILLKQKIQLAKKENEELKRRAKEREEKAKKEQQSNSTAKKQLN